jgi:hypothetical protein
MGTEMKVVSIGTEPLIELDPRELLGLSQVAKVSGKQEDVSRVLSKVGAEGPPPPPVSPLISRLLSKIGFEGPPPTGSE